MRMLRETGDVVTRIVGAEGVQHEEGIDIGKLRRADQPRELYAGAVLRRHAGNDAGNPARVGGEDFSSRGHQRLRCSLLQIWAGSTLLEEGTMVSLSLTSSLRRRVGEQIGIAVIDVRRLSPDLPVKAFRNPGFQLGICQPLNPSTISLSTACLNTAGIQVPVCLQYTAALSAIANRATQQAVIARNCTRRIGRRCYQISRIVIDSP